MFKKIALIICCILLCTKLAHADDKALIATVYTTIADKHLIPVEISETAITALKSLNKIDKNLTFADGKEMVYLYYKRQTAGLWHKPENGGTISDWAEITSAAIEKAAKISPKAAKEKEYLVEKIFHAAAASLKDHSQYHFSDEIEEVRNSQPFSVKTDGKFLYIKIKGFSTDTASMVKNALARHPQTAAVIIDLRGNAGGQLNAAIEVAKLFIDDGIIVATKGRDNNSAKYYVSEQHTAFNLPLAVLIDQTTASSAEVLAAALKEQAQAQLIGTLSYGKGTIQDIYLFDNGGKLALTTGQFFTPSGSRIEKIGLFPDYCIINDKLVTTPPCPQQKRENKSFDINFAKQVLSGQI
uniref:Tail specific protease domain-containing protein n=1 Tax=uncultured Alphaproteobacteria bacterium TaxID=91750 RepID=A0A6G8F367_9PROT|nr:hypothetical protein PlAlph_5760 [uncultured Alphaproteobacteria bacterium]